MPSNDLLKGNNMNGATSSMIDPHDDTDEVVADNEFEDSSWDPYCESVGDLGMGDSHAIDTLVDVSGCQTSTNNNNGSGPVSSIGSVSLDFDDGTLDVFTKFRDDLFIDVQHGAKCQRAFLLRKTNSCPNTPLRIIGNDK